MQGTSLIRAAIVLAAVAAVGLAVDLAVQGVDRAAELAGIAVGFCELAALVLGLAGWAADRRDGSRSETASSDHDATTTPKTPEPSPNSPRENYTVIPIESYGTIIGGKHRTIKQTFNAGEDPRRK